MANRPDGYGFTAEVKGKVGVPIYNFDYLK